MDGRASRRYFQGGLLLLTALLPSHVVFAQRDVRARIDEQRKDLSFLEYKTLEKARGFIRDDSTYYVGHMYQGAYMFYRANDKLGFTQVIRPLQRALRLIEKDYDRQLRTRSNNYNVYSTVYGYHRDYGLIAYMLKQSYENIESPDKALVVLDHVRDRNFQLELGVDSYNSMAWIYHRNRVYTRAHFPFLKNSVKENVKVASRYLDSALMKISKDIPLNMGLFDGSFLNRQYLSTYHYKALMYDYKLELDTANMYYDALIQNDAYSSNNYAEFKLAMGELPEADHYFREAEQREVSAEKRTKEYYYMRGTLDIYRGQPDIADTLLRKVLEEQGSTPGYGWHSIGLARALHFEGLTNESQQRNNKAARFQELHIGTTWGQEQYNLSVASLNYINQLQFEKEYLFENDPWWFWLNPVNWYKWVRFTLEIRHHKLLLASLVAANPEREQVIYPVFSSENLMTFDETWSVIEGFGNEFFIDVYKKRLATDKRPRLKKYFRYFLGKLFLSEGDESEATRYFMEALKDRDPEDPYQMLLYARIFEGLAQASSGKERDGWTVKLYETYPQLVPFSDLKMPFRLRDAAGPTDAASEVLSALKNCKIDFDGAEGSPVVSLQFSQTGESVDVEYRVYLKDRVLNRGTLRLGKDELDKGGILLAYRLFGINKQVIGERPEPVQSPVAAL